MTSRRRYWNRSFVGLLAGWVALFTALVCACGPDADQRLECEDLLPHDQATFDAVARLVVGPGAKSCAECHNTATPVWGYNFEARGLAYTNLSTKMGRIFPEIASGSMPKDREPWSVSELRLIESWYCYGAHYDEE